MIIVPSDMNPILKKIEVIIGIKGDNPRVFANPVS